MKLARILVTASCLSLLAGCANLLSIHRQNNITPAGGSSNPGAEITLIDAKQRAIITVQRPGDKDGASKTVVCAEPSPDALQAVAASTALTVRESEQKLAQLANSLSEAASNIGLRTQSIQLLRDAMYRLCEGYAAHAIDDDEFTTLHRRYQGLMLGLLAIEQLTGAVTNSQVALYMNAGATAGAAASELTAAEEKLKKEQNSLADLNGELKIARALLAELESEIKKAEDDKKMLKADETTKAAALTESIRSAKEKKIAKESEISVLEQKIKVQMSIVQNAQSAYSAASARVTASTGSSGSMIDGKTGRGLNDAQTAQYVSEAVTSIVNNVVTTAFNHDACFGLIDRFAREKVDDKYVGMVLKVQEACVELLKVSIENQAAQLRASTKLVTDGAGAKESKSKEQEKPAADSQDPAEPATK